MSETTISDKVLDRIRALLARTTANGCTEAEAAAAAAKVNEVLQAHNVSMSELDALGTPSGGPEKRDRTTTARSAMYEWQVDLMRAIARANFCRTWIELVKPDDNRQRKVAAKRHALIGRKVNVVAANMLYDYLVDTMERLLPVPPTERKSRAAHSWKLGCAARLTERINVQYRSDLRASETAKKQEAERRAAAGETGGTALMLVDVYGSEADLNHDAYWDLPAGTTARRRIEQEARDAASAALRAAEPVAPPTAHPSPAETAKERKAREARDARWERKWERQYERKQARIDDEMFYAGSQAGSEISLSKQVDADTLRKLK